MAKPIDPAPVLPFYAILLTGGIDIENVVAEMDSAGFRVGDLRGPAGFSHTRYYKEEMGDGLARYWVRGSSLIAPGELPVLKLRSNELEQTFAGADGKRPVNIDPGYIDMFAVVVATCKKLPAAVFLGNGVYGIIQLIYRNNACEPVPWTYKDYSDAASTLAEYRQYYLELKRKAVK